jgi:NAD(P)-dependent dehydrogenase (short-subunit alcohol dehydrogenase family)
MAAAIPPVALVTGGSRGIGRATAERLAARGVRVALHYHRNEAAAQEALAALAGEGHALFRADAADTRACAVLIESVTGQFGRLDVLVNNAAIYEAHDPLTVPFAAWEKTWQRTLDVCLTSPAHLAFLSAQQMRKQPVDEARASGRGRIVNISSRGAFRGEPTAPAYAAAKAGLNIFGQSLAQALAPDKIYVFTLAPGWVDTDMADALRGPGGPAILAQHPLGRVATPGEVADAAVWMALDAPATMTGCILDINGASYLRT